MRQDLRLVPAATATWLGAWLLTGLDEPSALRAALPWVGAALIVALIAALALSGGGSRPRLASPAQRPLQAVGAHLLLACACLGALTGSVGAYLQASQPLADVARQRAEVVLRGRVVSDGRRIHAGAERWRLAAQGLQHPTRSVWQPARGEVLVVSAGGAPPLGALVEVRGGAQPGEPGDRARAEVRTQRWDLLREEPFWWRWSTGNRQALAGVASGLSPQAQGLVPGMAVGDTSALPAELAAAFKATGLTHLTAVSGGHFAVVLTGVGALSGSLRLPRGVRALAIAVVACGFVLLVRPEPSVLRAVFMCALTVVGVLLGRRSSVIPALAVCVLVLLVADPWLARSYGLAMSCAASAGLVLLTGPLARRLEPWLGKPLSFAIAVPMAAQLVCGPILILLDPTVSAVSVPANLLASPAVVPATLLGLAAALLAGTLPGLASGLAALAALPTWWIAQVAVRLAALKFARLPWPPGPLGAALLAGITAGLVALGLRRPPSTGWPEPMRYQIRRWVAAPQREVSQAWLRYRSALATRRDRRVLRAAVGAGFAALLLFSGVLGAVGQRMRASDYPANWQVALCDVGQGDALVLRSGPDAAVLVDVGPPGAPVLRCLNRLGVRQIDLLVLTHDHGDHTGALDPVLAALPVASALVAATDLTTPPQLAAAGVDFEAPAPQVGGEFRRGDWRLTWQVLANPTPTTSGQPSAEDRATNDASLALWFEVGHEGETTSALTLGDLEEPGQQVLLRTLRERQPGVEVLKVAHHGSASQSLGLIRWLSPAVAMIGVGADNDYGHPTSKTLDRLAEQGSLVLRTDQCGTIILTREAHELAYLCPDQ